MVFWTKYPLRFTYKKLTFRYGLFLKWSVFSFDYTNFLFDYKLYFFAVRLYTGIQLIDYVPLYIRIQLINKLSLMGFEFNFLLLIFVTNNNEEYWDIVSLNPVSSLVNGQTLKLLFWVSILDLNRFPGECTNSRLHRTVDFGGVHLTSTSILK